MKQLLFCLLLWVAIGVLQAESLDERRARLQWMQKSLPEVPAFTAWLEQSGELPPDFDLLPRSNLLPDPLRFFDGRPVKNTAADWEARRAEMLGLFQKYMTGTFPPKPAMGKVELLSETAAKGYLTRNVKVWFGPEGKGSVRIQLIIPEGAPGTKFPVLISPTLGG